MYLKISKVLRSVWDHPTADNSVRVLHIRLEQGQLSDRASLSSDCTSHTTITQRDAPVWRDSSTPQSPLEPSTRIWGFPNAKKLNIIHKTQNTSFQQAVKWNVHGLLPILIHVICSNLLQMTALYIWMTDLPYYTNSIVYFLCPVYRTILQPLFLIIA